MDRKHSSYEAKAHFSEIIRRVRENGEAIVLLIGLGDGGGLTFGLRTSKAVNRTCRCGEEVFDLRALRRFRQ